MRPSGAKKFSRSLPTGGTGLNHHIGAKIIRLPLAPEEATKPAGDRHSDGRPIAESKARRILVVDDNMDSAQSLGMLLQLMGNEVRITHDGPTALEAAAAFAPNVVLLDIGMPSMDGYEVARRLRAMPQFENGVLIAQTGWSREKERQCSKEAGFDHHLVKPLDPDILQSLLDSLKPATQ